MKCGIAGAANPPTAANPGNANMMYDVYKIGDAHGNKNRNAGERSTENIS